jgi:hypothetical protein
MIIFIGPQIMQPPLIKFFQHLPVRMLIGPVMGADP